DLWAGSAGWRGQVSSLLVCARKPLVTASSACPSADRPRRVPAKQGGATPPGRPGPLSRLRPAVPTCSRGTGGHASRIAEGWGTQPPQDGGGGTQPPYRSRTAAAGGACEAGEDCGT